MIQQFVFIDVNENEEEQAANVVRAQDDVSGLRKWADLIGTGQKHAGNAPERAGKRRISPDPGSSIPGRISPDFPGDFRWFPAGTNRNLAELTGKIRRFPGPEYCFREIAGMRGNRRFPGPVSWTWVFVDHNFFIVNLR